MGRVLIVEDDQAMAVALRDGFEYEGYAVSVARDGAAGLRMATEKDLDLIILDVMLPKMSGLDICKQLRSEGNDIPIILLTARGQEIDKVLGLKLGADDYVTKPFSFMELAARVEAVLRRVSKHAEKVEVFQFGDMTLDFKKCEATKSGLPLDLSPREFKIMKY
ncbi:MAG TPA: response regulator transcription factor, partial [Blastocatellia bacterium]|nr:response regulator transcription factor [Blastocatellia bacterium]